MLAGVTLLALWGVIIAARRRAARRAAEDAEARARARRRPIPVVSSNLRGQPAREPNRGRDLWEEAAGDSTGPSPVVPLSASRRDG